MKSGFRFDLTGFRILGFIIPEGEEEGSLAGCGYGSPLANPPQHLAAVVLSSGPSAGLITTEWKLNWIPPKAP